MPSPAIVRFGLLVVATFALGCGNSSNSRNETTDDSLLKFQNAPATQACITELRRTGQIGVEQGVVIYSDHSDIEQIRQSHPETFSVTVQELKLRCQEAGFALE